MLKQVEEFDYEGESLLLDKVAKMLRRELANFNGFQFNGNFISICQQESVPSVLKMLISMLLNGRSHLSFADFVEWSETQ